MTRREYNRRLSECRNSKDKQALWDEIRRERIARYDAADARKKKQAAIPKDVQDALDSLRKTIDDPLFWFADDPTAKFFRTCARCGIIRPPELTFKKKNLRPAAGPHCERCFLAVGIVSPPALRLPSHGRTGWRGESDGDNPWCEYATRCLEETLSDVP